MNRTQLFEAIIAEAVKEERDRILGHLEFLRSHDGDPTKRVGSKIRIQAIDDAVGLIKGKGGE
jgi:hypothetical protein